MYDYINVIESESVNYFRIPKKLFTEEFKPLSAEAKLLYGLLLERTGVSKKNGWYDENNHVFIYYTIENIQEELGCGSQKAVRLMKELSDFGLIENVRQGLGKPNIIYVKSLFKNCENHNSRNVKITIQELLKSQSNNTDINNTEFNNINSNLDINNNLDYEYKKEKEINKEKEKIEVETISPFDVFWNHYPKKVAKANARVVFNKLVKNRETLQVILKDLEKRKRYDQWIKNNGQYIPNPTTYLNQKRWEDEYEINPRAKDNSWEAVIQQLEDEEYDE